MFAKPQLETLLLLLNDRLSSPFEACRWLLKAVPKNLMGSYSVVQRFHSVKGKDYSFFYAWMEVSKLDDFTPIFKAKSSPQPTQEEAIADASKKALKALYAHTKVLDRHGNAISNVGFEPDFDALVSIDVKKD